MNDATDGIVAYLDILGFREFLRANEPEDALRIVEDALARATKGLPKFLNQLNARRVAGARRTRPINVLVVSDSILVTQPLPANETASSRAQAWLDSISYLIALYRLLFDLGLPVRGAVARGRFLVHGTMFAGTPLIDAYELAGRLGCAGIAVHPTSQQAFLAAMDEMKIGLHHLAHEFMTSIGSQPAVSLLMLSPTLCVVPFVGDIRELISQSFLSHNKQLGPGAREKLDTTEVFFRTVQSQHPEAFVTPTVLCRSAPRPTRPSPPRKGKKRA